MNRGLETRIPHPPGEIAERNKDMMQYRRDQVLMSMSMQAGMQAMCHSLQIDVCHMFFVQFKNSDTPPVRCFDQKDTVIIRFSYLSGLLVVCLCRYLDQHAYLLWVE